MPNGQYQRLIFEKVDLREQEEDHLENFKRHCDENYTEEVDGIKQRNSALEWYLGDSRFALRILQGKKWNYDVAAQEILMHAEWKKATYPL